MSKTGFGGVIACALMLAWPAGAQSDRSGDIHKIVFFRAKPGMELQLEEGLKKHYAWHKQQGGKWSWDTWTFQTGEFSGGYASGTFNHAWSDFDHPDVDTEADAADVLKNIEPYVAAGAQWQYYRYMPDISKSLGKQTPMYEVIAFQVRYGKEDLFLETIGKFNAAIEKTKWPEHWEWHRRISGGENPFYVLVIPRENYAAMSGPDLTFQQMIVKAVGAKDAEGLFSRWAEAVQSENSHIEIERPDLSYYPEDM